MASIFNKVYYTNKFGDETDVTEFIGLDGKRGLQIRDAKTQIVVNNSRYRYKASGEALFTENGTFEFYVDYSPITRSSSQLLLTGQLQDISHGMASGGFQTKMSVSDKTNLLLSGVWAKNYNSERVDAIVRSVIRHAPSAENQVTTNNVVSTTTTGADFPLVDMSKTMKPIYEWLTDLSQPGVTGEDKAYLFYVDKDNDLHWFYPANTPSTTLAEGTDDVYNLSLKKSQDELVNMLIYNGGQDLVGNGVLSYKYNATSKSNKLRMKFQPMIDVGRDLMELEIQAGNLTQSSGGGFWYQGKEYAGTSYPLTPGWQGATSVANADAYNDAFREQVKSVCNERADAYMQAFAGLKWKGVIELRGNNNFVAGDLVTCDFPTIGLNNTNLRVWDVQQNIGPNGWVTGLELREDDEAISSS